MQRFAIALVSLLAAASCGGETNDSPGSGGSGGSAGAGAAGGAGGSAGSGGGASGAAGASIGCPVAPPTAGGVCSPGAALCVYSCEDCWCATGTWECESHPCKSLCSNPGAWCETPDTQCQCWGGEWTCQGPSSPALPSGVIADGAPCSDGTLACNLKGKNGAACKCDGGAWNCAPEGPPNAGCPASYADGESCADPGLMCTQDGFCPPTCLCKLDGSWSCVTYTPC